MKDTFFHQLFSTLNPLEQRSLQKFVASPYFNGRSQLSSFLEYFTKNNNPNPAEAFAAAFPQEPFDLTKFRLTLSQLNKLTERFVSFQEMEKEEDTHQLWLARAYRKRGLEKHFIRTIKKIEKHHEKEKAHSAERYEKKYAVEWEKYFFQSSGRRTENFNLQSVSDSMDVVFIARKLRHACLALSHQAVFKTEYKIGLLEEILFFLKNNEEILKLPAIELYFHCFQIFSDKKDEAYFEAFQKLLFEKGKFLPKEEQRNLFLLAINYGIRQINVGRPQYDRPVLKLYRMALENEFLLQNNRLSHFAFNNIVAIAVRIGATDWVEKFIQENKKYLERKYRNVAVSLGMARLEHRRKNYGEALLHLQKSDYSDFINNIIAKTLQLKIYFESDELEVLEYHLRNMKNYIRRKRAFGYHRENYLNIIKYTQAMVELNPFDKKEKEKLKKEITESEPLTEREWLLDMIK